MTARRRFLRRVLRMVWLFPVVALRLSVLSEVVLLGILGVVVPGAGRGDGRVVSGRLVRSRLSMALLGFLAFVSLSATSAAAQDGLFVTPREEVPYCARPHHRHWIQVCGRAILDAEPEKEDGGTIKSWTPEGAFAESFVARCAEILPGAADPHDPEECPCTRAEHAEWLAACVEDFLEVEPGMRRRQVEERFRRDGGVVMGGNLRLVHPECPMLKLDVAYELEPGGSYMDEPEALVLEVGEPYLEYPISD